MQKNLTIEDIDELSQACSTTVPIPTPYDLKLVTKKIPIKYCEYKISNTANKMLLAESIGISVKGLLFQSLSEFKQGSLLRVWVELPDYWARKSKIVEYRHTEAPTFFQILARVLSSEEILKRGTKFQILCENLTIDNVDEIILNEYLNLSGTLK